MCISYAFFLATLLSIFGMLTVPKGFVLGVCKERMDNQVKVIDTLLCP